MTLTEDSLDEILDNFDMELSKMAQANVPKAYREAKSAIIAAHHQDIEEAVREARIDEIHKMFDIHGKDTNHGWNGTYTVRSYHVADRLAQLQTKPEGKPLMRICYEKPIGTHVIRSKPDKVKEGE